MSKYRTELRTDRGAKMPLMNEDELMDAVKDIRLHFNDPDAAEDAWNTGSKYYNFNSGNWPIDEPSIKTAVCDGVIDRIIRAEQDPREYAKQLYNSNKKGERAKAKLIFRCVARKKWGEECTDEDISTAFGAMGLSDNTDGSMDAWVDGILFGTGASSGASYGGAIHQAGGAPHDLATLLFLKRNLIDKLVEVGPEYAVQLITWIDGQLGQLKGCVQDILGINPDTFYDDITSYIGGLYNQTAGIASDATSAVSGWIKANKLQAIGLSAFIVRYQGVIITTGRTFFQSLATVFNAVATAGATTASVINQFLLSDPGLAALLLLYYYDQNAEEVNDFAIRALTAGIDVGADFMAALARFEAFSNRQINDFAQVKLNDDLIKMLATVKKSIADSTTVDAGHRAELARILDATAKTQIKIVETAAQAARTRSQTARIAAAKATLNTVQDQLTDATRALIVAELAAMNASKGARKGGKSHSRKLHKKVSKSKRPKRSVHSRKAKGVKRSNKKH